MFYRWVGWLGMCWLPVTAAPLCQASSPSYPQPLVELYTSEGCSSCPPADVWLGRLPAEVNALAWHVDYWNGLGWTDALSQSAWSRRQQLMVQREGGNVVYTPQVMLNGRSLEAWEGSRVQTVRQTRARVSLQLQVLSQDAQGLWVSLMGKADGVPVRYQLALTRAPFSHAIARGENAGRTLSHQHAVLWSAEVTGDGQRVRLPALAEVDRLVAWADAPRSPQVWQSLSMTLSQCATAPG